MRGNVDIGTPDRLFPAGVRCVELSATTLTGEKIGETTVLADI